MHFLRALLSAALLATTLLPVAPLRADDTPETLVSDPLGAPMRVRNYTFPTYVLLGFAPQPAAALGKGNWALELHHSVINNFQVSAAVEDYLADVRGAVRRPLDATDAAFILGLPGGKGFYIDGEFEFTEVVAHYGVTDRFDIGVGLSFMDFGGGSLDGTIFDFHETFGYGQQGRNLVADDQFQIVIGQDGSGLSLIEGVPSGGVGDPSLYLRYFLGQAGRWQFNVSAGVKIPLADEAFLSSGGTDVGLQLTADGRWRRNAWIFNLGVVEAETFEQQGVDPPLLTSLHASWLRSVGAARKTRLFIQVLAAEHAFADLFDSAISELELQVTFGLKRATKAGVFGFGLTENLIAFDNTPDIGIHLSWGYLSK